MGRLSIPSGLIGRTGRRPPVVPVRWIALTALALLLLGGGYLWFRGSSLVAVKQVDVIGVSSSQGALVKQALDRAARQMTTLDVSVPELRASVADFASVRSLRVQAGFPHHLTVEVIERTPVAVVELGGQSVPVGAGGRIMRGITSRASLPDVHASGLSSGGRVTDRTALRAVAALAAAPAALRTKVAKASWARKGLTLELRDGPLLIFGDASRPHAKWAAAARVLADPSSAGAVYLDVRVPERVAAGGLGATAESQDQSLDASGTGQATNPEVQPEESTTLDP